MVNNKLLSILMVSIAILLLIGCNKVDYKSELLNYEVQITNLTSSINTIEEENYQITLNVLQIGAKTEILTQKLDQVTNDVVMGNIGFEEGKQKIYSFAEQGISMNNDSLKDIDRRMNNLDKQLELLSNVLILNSKAINLIENNNQELQKKGIDVNGKRDTLTKNNEKYSEMEDSFKSQKQNLIVNKESVLNTQESLKTSLEKIRSFENEK